LVTKKGDESYYWFDNFIRIKKAGSELHIDVYEYYWANKTENKTNIQGITKWLGQVVSGGIKHYKVNKALIKALKIKAFLLIKMEI